MAREVYDHRKPRLMIMGYGRHGKDTAAEYLRDKYGLTFQSSSIAAAEAIFPLLQSVRDYGSVEEAFEDRHSVILVGVDDGQILMREVWHQAIKLLNKGDPTTLAKQIYAKSDIYVGIRSKEEFNAIKSKRMFDLSIWIDRGEHLPPEAEVSCTVSPDMADLVVNNNGTLEDLYNNLDIVMKRYLGVDKCKS